MSVLSYLEKRASEAVLSDVEKQSVNTSVATLATRMSSNFGTSLSEQLRFGSSTRGTILPRSMDGHSDIDYMVEFADSGHTPQTYLDRVKRFAEKYYYSSDIKQSSPTIVLELNHIKFDLVPALKSYVGYKIVGGHPLGQAMECQKRVSVRLLRTGKMDRQPVFFSLYKPDPISVQRVRQPQSIQ
jgi:predicted nucleotidyltransferase